MKKGYSKQTVQYLGLFMELDLGLFIGLDTGQIPAACTSILSQVACRQVPSLPFVTVVSNSCAGFRTLLHDRSGIEQRKGGLTELLESPNLRSQGVFNSILQSKREIPCA